MARQREQRYVTGYAQPDERGRIIVQLDIQQLPPPYASGRLLQTWCEVSETDVRASAAARGASDWTVEDVRIVAGCVGIRM